MDRPPRLRVLFQLPSLDTVYAYRTIHEGFKNGFEALGHQFRTLTSQDRLADVLETYRPHLFITKTHDYFQKFIDLKVLHDFREATGMIMATKVDFWRSQFGRFRINEAKSLSNEREKTELIRVGLLGDIFFHVAEQGDPRMEGFVPATGKRWHTLRLACDLKHHFYDPDPKFVSDIAYVGTNLPEKRRLFRERLFPLRKDYDVRVYGQDWTLAARGLGFAQKIGQYFAIPWLARIQKPKLGFDDERKIYSSAQISVNFHEASQREMGGDVNERFFKILGCGGFQVTDWVASMDRLVPTGSFVAAKTEREWFDAIDTLMHRPEERRRRAEKGYDYVRAHHSYVNRALELIALCDDLWKNRSPHVHAVAVQHENTASL